ncbi:hypothetical protein T4E_8787 [Trichinella pseudospiralis]|uniref:Uncharacterized protein n=1 Tax=Trichinella pseudospiralis TaxID=6337 RepID=A0A0V0Y574_TRIPS|nr:hypothetical protein T4E_8787 [Trichinella pseudospiralis]
MENGKLPSRLLAFLSSYLVERGFSVVTDFLTKRRSRLQIVKRGDLRLFLTNTQLAIGGGAFEKYMSLKGMIA